MWSVLSYVQERVLKRLRYGGFKELCEAAETDTQARDKALARKKDTLSQAEKRIAELDLIYKRIYEDNITRNLTDERFIKLSRDYELEQDNLKGYIQNIARRSQAAGKK